MSNDKLVMTKSSEIQLRQSSMPFEEFKNNFLHQDVTVPQTIDHIHILSYDGKTMKFISLHNTEFYLVAKTNGLDLIKDILSQIVAKETLIKDQINNFLSDIIKNNVSFYNYQKTN